MADPVKQDGLATFADLEALGLEERVEIIHGTIVEKTGPTAEHSVAQASLGGVLVPRFSRRPGGRWPGGWRILSEADVEYGMHELYCHDLAGWRRERMPELPQGRSIRLAPDWVCEILSPSNSKRDLVDKHRVLHAAGVPHYWILNPMERVLVVHRHSDHGYVVVLTAGADEAVRAEPFDAIELRVGVLFGDDDPDDDVPPG